MATIIDQILQIDSVAQKKLDEAEQIKVQYEQETKEEIARTNAAIQADADRKIDAVRQELSRQSEQEKESISARSDAELRRLKQIYEENHEKLEQDIVRNVLGL